MMPGEDASAEELSDVVEAFAHLSIAVNDISRSLALVGLLGGEYLTGGTVAGQGFRWVQFQLPGAAKLELVQPLDATDENNFLVRFLRARGEGVHHLTFRVDDVRKAVGAAKARGFKVVGINTDSDWKEAFVHPKSAHGVLIQFAQWKGSARIVALEDVLAGNAPPD